MKRAVVLFTGDARAEEARKGLPRRFLQSLHRNLEASIRAAEDVDLVVASDSRDGFRLELPTDRVVTCCRDLGERVEASLDALAHRGYESVLLVAGDLAGVATAVFENAFDELERTDCVFAPSRDGGFSLVGLRVETVIDWARIPWLTPDAADGMRAELARRALGSIELPAIDDIDDRASALRMARRPGLSNRLRTSMLGALHLQPMLGGLHDRRPHPVLAEANLLRAPPLS